MCALHAFFCLILESCPIVIGLPLAVFSGLHYSEALFFTLPFVFLRRFSGGFHCQTLSRCMAISITSLFFHYHLIQAALVLPIASAAVLFLFLVSLIELYLNSPLIAEGCTLSKSEKRLFCIITRIQLASYCVLALILLYLDEKTNVICLMVGVIFTAA